MLAAVTADPEIEAAIARIVGALAMRAIESEAPDHAVATALSEASAMVETEQRTAAAQTRESFFMMTSQKCEIGRPCATKIYCHGNRRFAVG